MKHSFLFIAMVLGFWTSSAHAAISVEEARQMMTSSVDRVLEILRDPGLQGAEKRSERWGKLRSLSDEVFDWASMAQRSLGVHWRSLDEGQRARFVDTFKELIAANYLGQMDAFQGEERVNFKGTEATSKGQVWVNMELITQSRQKVPLSFLVAESREVKDVKIEEISITSHYRDSLNRLFVNGSFDSVMKRLDAKAAANRRIVENASKKSSKGGGDE